MDAQGLGLAVGTGLAAKKGLELVFELVSAALLPTATAAGELLASPVVQLNQRRAARAKRILELAQEQLGDSQQTTAPPDYLLLPIVQHATLVDDAEMQAYWAALIANCHTQAGLSSMLPAFPEILAQLTPTHARVLKALYNVKPGAIPLRSGTHKTLPESRLLAVAGLTGLPALDQYHVIAADLDRLKLVESPLSAATRLGTSVASPQSYAELTLTYLGVAFVRACLPPSQW